MESEIVKEEIRDEVMKNILSVPSNQYCFDCGSRRPRWASPYLGIILCMECAGRHRSYGTHISFIKSVDLDKWNKKQLKSLELTGNFYMKKKFEKLKIPKINNLYDYNNELIFEIRKNIENLVKENLKKDDYNSKEEYKIKNNNINDNNNDNKNEIEFNNNNIEDNDKDYQNSNKPIKFNLKKDVTVKKEIKKNKIKKLDIDFDFDNFQDNTNSNKEKIKEKEINPKNIQGMKLSRIDKKKALIEERNKKKNENKKEKKFCEKFKEYIYYIFCFWKRYN